MGRPPACLQAAPPPAWIYLGQAAGAARSVVLDAMQHHPLAALKDALSALSIDRRGARGERALAERVIDSVPHSVLAAAPAAAQRHGLALLSAEAEAAALGELLAAASQEGRSGGQQVFAVEQQLYGGELQLVAAQTSTGLLVSLEGLLGRRLVPPNQDWRADWRADAQGTATAPADQVERLVSEIQCFVTAMLERAAALEGYQLSQLPAQAMAELETLALTLGRRRLLSGESSAIPTQPGKYNLVMQATVEDMEQLRASIHALRLPPAPGVPRCAACGAIEAPPALKLRRCSRCRCGRR